MKRSFFLLCVFAVSSHLFSQGFQVSAFGSGKSTWLFNKSISDKGDEQNYAAGWGYNYGLGVNYLFTERLGCEIDFLMNAHSGNYEGSIAQPSGTAVNTYESNSKFSTFDIPVLFRFLSSGSYLETGPQYSFVSKAVYNSAGDLTGTGQSLKSDYDIKSFTSKSYISGVFGFGIEAAVSDHFLIRTGLRLEYSFTDLKGVDAMGNDFSNPFFYTKINSTHPASGGLLLGVTYSFNARKDKSINKLPPPPTLAPPPPPPGN